MNYLQDNLPATGAGSTKEWIKKSFQKFGDVEYVSMPDSGLEPTWCKFAFVEFSKSTEAEAALKVNLQMKIQFLNNFFNIFKAFEIQSENASKSGQKVQKEAKKEKGEKRKIATQASGSEISNQNQEPPSKKRKLDKTQPESGSKSESGKVDANLERKKKKKTRRKRNKIRSTKSESETLKRLRVFSFAEFQKLKQLYKAEQAKNSPILCYQFIPMILAWDSIQIQLFNFCCP